MVDLLVLDDFVDPWDRSGVELVLTRLDMSYRVEWIEAAYPLQKLSMSFQVGLRQLVLRAVSG